MLDVVVVGSGPAGLSAAIYTSRAGLSTLVASGDTQGGLLTTTEKVDNYLGLYGSEGIEMADNFLDHAKQFGAKIRKVSAQEIHINNEGVFETTFDNGKTIQSKSVIYAAGSNPRKLGVSGEDLNSVSYCATCDGSFFADEEVVVVGGGETAAEDALYLSQMCKKVTVLVRSAWRATEPAVHKLEEQENVEIRLGVNVSEILGENDNVKSVVLNNGETLDASGVFIAVGQEPNSKVAERHSSVYDDGFIECSNVEGFFVAGDIKDPEYRQVVIAAGDGAKAGIDATRYVLNN